MSYGTQRSSTTVHDDGEPNQCSLYGGVWDTLYQDINESKSQHQEVCPWIDSIKDPLRSLGVGQKWNITQSPGPSICNYVWATG